MFVRSFYRLFNHPIAVANVLGPGLRMSLGRKGRLTQVNVLQILKLGLVEQLLLHCPLPIKEQLGLGLVDSERHRAHIPLAAWKTLPEKLRVQNLFAAATAK